MRFLIRTIQQYFRTACDRYSFISYDTYYGQVHVPYFMSRLEAAWSIKNQFLQQTHGQFEPTVLLLVSCVLC